MALKGNLQDFPIANLLSMVRSTRRTGTLTVEAPSQAIRLAFREGQLIHAAYAEHDHLLSILEQAGVLTREQARAVMARTTDASDKELALMLISAGTASQEDILTSVRGRTMDIACEVFTWPTGEFRFDDSELPSDDRITVPLATEDVVAEADRRREEAKRRRAALPSPSARFRVAATPPQGQIDLPPEAWQVLPFIDPRNTLLQIAQAAHLDEDQAQRVLRDLLQAGIIETET
jgi:hypothetical protein